MSYLQLEFFIIEQEKSSGVFSYAEERVLFNFKLDMEFYLLKFHKNNDTYRFSHIIYIKHGNWSV
jgi:hypothetical protein